MIIYKAEVYLLSPNQNVNCIIPQKNIPTLHFKISIGIFSFI